MRATTKATIQFIFGRSPGGTHLYRYLTRNRMGTQATHVDKIARVWPDYISVWISTCGLQASGANLWVHEGGWTPIPFLLGYSLTGNGVTVTNHEAKLLDKYADHALTKAKSIELPEHHGDISALPIGLTSLQIVEKVNGKLMSCPNPGQIALENNSMDLCHSGGALEHYQVEKLRSFAKESYRILRPGGIASHVFDHRDHLYHADKSIPFLWHLSFSDTQYRLLFGHALGFHNRLLPSQIKSLFESVGFQTVTIRRRVLPSLQVAETPEDFNSSLIGLDRNRLAKRFTEATDIDLRTAAAHYLFRKPA